MPENMNTDFHCVAFVQALDAQDTENRNLTEGGVSQSISERAKN